MPELSSGETKVDKERLRRWLCEERRLPAPVELKMGDAVGIRLDQLSRKHFHRPTARAKITNNGKTVVLSGKWKNTRPYIFGGPFDGKYVFSMLHFHWSQNNSKGSMHSVDGEKYPLEMHVVYFKAKYIYYEEAAKYEDGVIFEVHFFYIQEDINDSLSPLIEKLSDVHRSGTSVAVEEFALARYVTIFVSDYFLYCGTIMDGRERQRVTWIICRHASGVSSSQMNEFRQLLGQDGFPLIRNNHKMYKIGNRQIYHVNGSGFVTEILYPYPKIFHKKTEKLRIRFRFKSSNKVNKSNNNDKNKKKEGMKKNAHLQKNQVNGSNKKIIYDKSKIVNLDEKQYAEPGLRRRNIIDSVVQWLRNSAIQNREEITSLYETIENEKEECSIEKESTTAANSTKIHGSIPEVQSMHGAIKNKKTWYDDYSIELSPSAKPIDCQSVEPNPQDTFCRSIYNQSAKNRIHKKNKVKLFSDFESNFTQQVMNRSKLENDGKCVSYLRENSSLYRKSLDTIKKKVTEITSKHNVTLEQHKKNDKELEKKLSECNDRLQSSETLTKSLLTGFKNMYLKYKHDFDNRNSLNKINNTEQQNVIKKEDKACSTETKESSKNFIVETLNNNHQGVRERKNHLKREKSDSKNVMESNSESDYSLSFASLKNDCENVTSGKLYYVEKKDKKTKLKIDKKIVKSIDILTPLKLDLDFLPNNFKDINDLNGRKHQLRKKNKHLKETDIIHNDSILKKHKRTQTLKISKSSSSEPKNIIYISNHMKKPDVVRRASDPRVKKKVKFENRVKKYSNHRIKSYSNHKIGTQYNKGARSDFKFSANKEKNPFGNVKVRETSSHESVYIFIKNPIDDETNTNVDKKKTGILHEWLLTAKDMITGPRP